jgi:DNA-binding XRE family transcriptional regulator
VAKTYFEDFVGAIQAEAEAEGPEAVAQLESLHHRFRLAGELVMLRKRRGVSQRKLAEAAGVHQSEISRIERGVGNPTEDTLARMGQALGAHLSFVPDSEAVAV